MSDWWSGTTDPWAQQESADRRITFVTRRSIFDYLRTNGFALYGGMDELPFLGRLYDLAELPSTDSRFATAAQDIAQHRVRNWDWDDDWIYTDPRLQLGSGPDDVLLEFLAQLVHPVVRPDESQAREIRDALNDLLRPDGWQLITAGSMSGHPVYAPARAADGGEAVLQVAHDTATRVDSSYISRQVTRMEGAIETDPELAIGTAKEFLETICKTILERLDIAVDRNDDVLQLVRKTTRALNLTRDDVDPTAPAAETIRRTLSSLAQIAQGAAELRNLHGTGHGRAGSAAATVHPRHARLVVGAATTLASFLWETFEAL